ncbi:GNAT family N-acetyltransferase [Streptomyces sp. XY431]|uniref:GNAT family N-acetyltransferase n=1 Tax=Streptomyces sp. XY431 TaxID=1415562 RepID=UPI0006AED3C4|nr:GNAT family N-acetyltransferase [Streptomyces sp. XY431]
MPSTRPLDDPSEPHGTDPLFDWLTRGRPPGPPRTPGTASRPGTAWRLGGALALAGPGLADQDWLAIRGPADEAAALLQGLPPAPARLLVGAPALVERLALRLDLPDPEPLVLMVADRPPYEPGDHPPYEQRNGPTAAHWLPRGQWTEVDALLDLGFPSSLARPCGPGVHRWAGVRAGAGGPLAAVAAEAWSGPGLGFVGGVATHPEHRGLGYAATVCAFVLHELVAEHGRAALLVDGWNLPALALYRRLGMVAHPLASTPARA